MSNNQETNKGVTSPTDSIIAGDFGNLSAAEQEKQREEWKQELKKIEEEIQTLRQVMADKEDRAMGLKRRLGITAWREFSEDMQQGLKQLQESDAYKSAAQGISQAATKTTEIWNSVTHSQGFQNVSNTVGNVVGAAKEKISGAMPQTGGHETGQVHNQQAPNPAAGTDPNVKKD